MQRVEIAGLYQIRTKSQVRRALHHRALQTRPARKDERSEANFGTTTRHSPCTKLRLDTGSDITLLNVDEWKRLGSPKLKDTSIVVKDASLKAAPTEILAFEVSRSPCGRLPDNHNGNLSTEKSGLSVEILPWTQSRA
ncbi:hypothetical protein Y032_0246g39 [Ancylostoma ceylanicum]|uniref:Peptidase A2 domain-containing protein n=1 Tax=Ancylostoma ceylanicum TaxID=53326 RepID=A0A016SDX1_9BILA|nr:hypothetical protein Y032_0246g39 [Ancylostoma ceylanicum]